MLRLMESLEELDDVQRVYTNVDFQPRGAREVRRARVPPVLVLGIDPGIATTGYGCRRG